VKTFVLRELRRQSSVALGAFVLGLLVLGGSFFYKLDRYGLESAAAVSFVAVIVVAALLLGVASVAPDTESGAMAFLAHLPRSLRRELLARWGVAAFLVVVAGVLDYGVAHAFAGSVPFEVFKFDQIPIWLLAILAFAVGAASSVAFRQTITSLVFAPAFAIPILALKAEGEVLGGWRSDVGTIFLACGSAFALVGAAAGFLRGDLHRSSWRPLALVLGALLGGAALTTGSALAYDQVPGRWEWSSWPTLRSVHGDRLVLSRYRTIGLGRRADNRMTVLSTTGGKPIDIDGGNALSFSPDGSKLLVVAESLRSFRLLDIATGRFEEKTIVGGSVTSYWTEHGDSWLSLNEPGASRVPVAWRGGVPVLAARGVLEPWRGEVPKILGRVESLGGTRALECLESGERVVHDLESGERLQSGFAALPAGDRSTPAWPTTVRVVEARLTSDGDWVVAIAERRPGTASLFFVGVGNDRCHEVPLGRFDVLHGPWVLVHVTPERFLVEANSANERWPQLVDARTGAVEVLDVLSVTLSPHGTRLLTRDLVLDERSVLDAATKKPLAQHLGRVTFFDEDRLLQSEDGREVRLRDIETGRDTVLLR